ncbi:hypothetical protein DFS34DRAFT_589327 [Phlyctochytrium arcticum]|nr:hypothetical protein DFS34DRAFT_589327 [Phlyctochytrium arcticum]
MSASSNVLVLFLVLVVVVFVVLDLAQIYDNKNARPGSMIYHQSTWVVIYRIYPKYPSVAPVAPVAPGRIPAWPNAFAAIVLPLPAVVAGHKVLALAPSARRAS